MSGRAWLLLAMVVVPACSPNESLPDPPVVFSAPLDVPSARDYAWSHMHWPLSAEEAEAILANTGVFADEAVFFSGEPSPQVVAFNVLLDQSDASRRLERLVNGDNWVGRLYALCGFQVVNHVGYSALREELKKSAGEVGTQFGCSGGRSKVAVLASEIDERGYGRRFRKNKAHIYALLGTAG